MKKTNAMRKLEELKIDYQAIEYDANTEVDGEVIASVVHEDPKHVYKTLVIEGVQDHAYYVFCIPVNDHLDLKKAARLTGEKKLDMLAMKDLRAVTGYIRGGVSPLGMKKDFPTFVQEIQEGPICISAGKKGMQIKLDPRELVEKCGFSWGDIVKE